MLTNQQRIAQGKFCCCEGTDVCDFHKRGGYTTKEDDIEYEVVWSGKDELLPPRDQHPDPTWTAPKQQVNKNRKQPNLERKGNGDDNGQY